MSHRYKKPRAYIATTDTPGQRCPKCQHKIDQATGAAFQPASQAPAWPRLSPGALTVCVYCLAVLRFDEGMVLRLVPENEAKRLLDANPTLRIAVLMAQEFRAQELVKRN